MAWISDKFVLILGMGEATVFKNIQESTHIFCEDLCTTKYEQNKAYFVFTQNMYTITHVNVQCKTKLKLKEDWIPPPPL